MTKALAVRRQCSAHSRSDPTRRCRKSPIKGGSVCASHGGASPAVKSAAKQRLLEAADPVMASLVKLALDARDDADPQMRIIRLKAMADVLDRVPELSKRRVSVTEREDSPEAVAEREAELHRIVDEGVAKMRRRQADALGTQILTVDGRPV